MHDHEYHERLNTHGMVLDRRADIERSDTMIYTIEKNKYCLQVPDDARQKLGQLIDYTDVQ